MMKRRSSWAALVAALVAALFVMGVPAPTAAFQQGYCPEQDGRLWLMADDGSGERKLARADNSFDWSPDGSKLAVAVARRSAIRVLDKSGDVVTTIADTPGCDAQPQWSPDGRQIAFVGHHGNQGTVWLADADGSRLHPLATMENLHSALWAPDSTRLAFVAGHDLNRDVFVIGSDGSDLRNVTANPSANYMADWAPNSQALAFTSNRSGNFEIYTVAVDGSGLQRLTDDTRSDLDPEWSPDGARIAFVRHHEESDARLWVMSSAGGDEKDLTGRDDGPRFRDLDDPRWGSSGADILFAAYPFGSPANLYSVAAEAGNLVQLTHFGSFARNARWSPGGDEIAFVNELVERGVSLELGQHLDASGDVRTLWGAFTGIAACVAAVPVVIQRQKSGDWRQVVTATTVNGSFTARIPDKAGMYRAVTPESDSCGRAVSPIVPHGH